MAVVPERIDELLSTWGIFVPSDIKEKLEAGSPDGMGEMYERALSGRCMLCDADLGKDTLVVIGAPFRDAEVVESQVLMIFCSGICLRDMQVIGWIQQTHEDMEQSIEFRGGKGGN